MQTAYRVIQPLGDSRELRLSGPTISTHRTVAAAMRAVSAANRAVQSQPGGQSSWVERVILAVEPDGEVRQLTEDEDRDGACEARVW